MNTASLILAALFGLGAALPLHAVELGEKAPDFVLQDASGAEVRLSDFTAKGPVYLDFWASWCGPCRKSFPWMNELQTQQPGLKVVAVNLDKRREEADRFLADNKPGFSILFDPSGGVAEAWKLKGMPTSYLIDREGIVRVVHRGFRPGDGEKLSAEAEKLTGSLR